MRTLSSLLCCSLLIFNGCAPLVVGVAAGATGGAVESVNQPKSYGPGAYAGSIAGSALYFPAKVIFAAGGAVASGLTWTVTGGDRQRAGRVWDTTVNGDYVLTPGMVAGNEPIRFVGSNSGRARLATTEP